MDALKLHPKDVEINRQGFALLFNIINHDPQTKYSLAQARQAVLVNGMVDIVENANKEFRMIKDIRITGKGILDLIIQNWS